MNAAEKQQQPEIWPVTVDWQLDFLHASAREAASYWHSLLKGRAMPARRELSPRAMKGFIPYVSLLDVVPGTAGKPDYVVTLQGGHARDVFGDIKGRRPAEIFHPVIEQRWRRCFDLPYASRKPARLLSRASTSGKNWLVCEALVAPLGQGGEVQSFLWVFVSWPANDPGHPPSAVA